MKRITRCLTFYLVRKTFIITQLYNLILNTLGCQICKQIQLTLLSNISLYQQKKVCRKQTVIKPQVTRYVGVPGISFLGFTWFLGSLKPRWRAVLVGSTPKPPPTPPGGISEGFGDPRHEKKGEKGRIASQAQQRILNILKVQKH